MPPSSSRVNRVCCAVSTTLRADVVVVSTARLRPLIKPDGRISRTKCGASHLIRHVVNWVMWCQGGMTFDSLIHWGFSSGVPGQCWTSFWSVAYCHEPSLPEHPTQTGDGTSAAALPEFCPRFPGERKNSPPHRPFKPAASPRSAPVHPGAILESAVHHPIMHYPI